MTTIYILIFDEWQAFLAYLEQTDKKKHKEILSKNANDE